MVGAEAVESKARRRASLWLAPTGPTLALIWVLTFMTISFAEVLRTTNPAPCGDTLPDRCDPGSLRACREGAADGP